MQGRLSKKVGTRGCLSLDLSKSKLLFLRGANNYVMGFSTYQIKKSELKTENTKKSKVSYVDLCDRVDCIYKASCVLNNREYTYAS